jgi:hypothetical protein
LYLLAATNKFPHLQQLDNFLLSIIYMEKFPMINQQARPQFGKPLMVPAWYATVTAFVESLRPTTTQRNIARLLNDAGYRTPTGKPWDRQGVANFLRKKSV